MMGIQLWMKKEIKARFEEGAKVNVVLGEIKRSDLLGVELCIISPGIPLTSPFVAVVDEARIPILGEVELAYQCSAGKLAAITGTNGKTTTTALTGAMVRKKIWGNFCSGKYRRTFYCKSSRNDRGFGCRS